MQSLDLQPIFNEPALFDKNKKILVVADLQYGLESVPPADDLPQPCVAGNG